MDGLRFGQRMRDFAVIADVHRREAGTELPCMRLTSSSIQSKNRDPCATIGQSLRCRSAQTRCATRDDG